MSCTHNPIDLTAKRPASMKRRLLVPVALLAVIGASLTGCETDKDTVDSATSETATTAPAKNAPSKAKPAAKPAAPAIKTTAKAMIALLESNALKAKNTYDDKRVIVTGFVGDIDASGKYFSLDPEPDSFVITGVQVQLDKKFKNQVANFNKNQAVTVTGKITNVGEIMGYSLEAESIK